MKKEIVMKVLQDYFTAATADTMIGYMFIGKDINRLIEKEIELTLGFFNSDVTYSGRSLREAHFSLKVKKGHFDRRMVLMRQAMEKNNLPDEVINKWLEHNEMARDIVTAAPMVSTGECTHAKLGN